MSHYCQSRSSLFFLHPWLWLCTISVKKGNGLQYKSIRLFSIQYLYYKIVQLNNKNNNNKTNIKFKQNIQMKVSRRVTGCCTFLPLAGCFLLGWLVLGVGWGTSCWAGQGAQGRGHSSASAPLFSPRGHCSTSAGTQVINQN